MYELSFVNSLQKAFSAACQRNMRAHYGCGSGSANKQFCMCFLIKQEANEVILVVWLMTLEGARLLELHSSASVASGMSLRE